jgi:hypothetical protein
MLDLMPSVLQDNFASELLFARKVMVKRSLWDFRGYQNLLGAGRRVAVPVERQGANLQASVRVLRELS